ncbi:MAG: hypothetical protein Q4C66_11785 [Lachnospiraceae bacterium]|nr:hypothetical protein [Lachnospiraceae bacterium]
MTLLMRDQENIEKGRERGEEMMAELIRNLSMDQRTADIVRATTDKEYRRKLYEEYKII